MRKQRLISFIIAVLIILTFGVVSGFAEVSTNTDSTENIPKLAGTNTELVVDKADLLTNKEEEKLLDKLLKLREKYDIDFVVVTVDSLEGKSAMAYADDYLDYNDYKEDGVLLLIAMETRDYWISTVGTRGMYAVRDAGVNYIEGNVVPQLSKGNYYKAFNNFADSCDYLAKKAKNGKPLNSYKSPFKPGIAILTSLGVGVILAICVGIGLTIQMKPVMDKKDAKEYTVKGSFKLTGKVDRFISEHRAVQRHERSSGGGGRGSSSHTSSSGRSHGGGGGKF